MEDRPEFRHAVLDRRTAQSDIDPGVHLRDGTEGLRIVVIDVLGFIQNHRIEIAFLIRFDILPETLIRGDRNSVLGQLGQLFFPFLFYAADDAYLKQGCKFLEFVLPVVDQ